MKRIARGAGLACLLLLSSLAHAQLFRAYVASYGSDSNPCTVAQPCRLLPAALNAVADGGEIWMLDSANYNQSTVTIAKSVTIQAIPGQVGSIVAVGANAAIGIDTPGVRVTLRNLAITSNAANPGNQGVIIFHADSVSIESSVIYGLPGHGVSARDWPTRVNIVDTIIRDTGMSGVALNNGSIARILRSTLRANEQGGIGVGCSTGDTVVHVSDSSISGSVNGTGVSVGAGGSGCRARAFLTRVAISDMAQGVYAESTDAGATALIQVASSALVNNGFGFQVGAAVGPVSIESLGNNDISRNTNGDVGTLAPVAPR